MSGFVSSGFSVGSGAGYKGAFVMAIVGGTVSELGGGKFSNGAMGSAFQYLFNDAYQVGISTSVGAGAGASTSIGIAIAHDSSQAWYKGWNMGWYNIVSEGLMAGTDASITADLTYSENNHISDLAGQSIVVGGSIGNGRGYGYELSIPVNSSASVSQTVSVGIHSRPVPIPLDVHVCNSNTEIHGF